MKTNDIIKVGIYYHQIYSAKNGGAYYYLEYVISVLSGFNKNIEIVIITDSKTALGEKVEHLECIKLPFSNLKIFLKKEKELYFRLIQKVLPISSSRKISKFIEEKLYDNIHFLYYLTPDVVFDNFPYIVTFWDLGHVNSHAFPECTMNNLFEWRYETDKRKYYKALHVFTESENGKDLLKAYLGPILSERISVLNLPPSLMVLEKAQLNSEIKLIYSDILIKDFVFYPAQFLSYKNHVNLVYAFHMLIEQGLDKLLVFTGADKGNLNHVKSIVNKLNLNERVLFLGFVDTPTLKWLYLNSKGLVFPTFMGPSNMPIIEAYYLGCPVAASDFKGHQEQVNEKAFYFNPHSIAEIHRGLHFLFDNTTLKRSADVSYDLIKGDFAQRLMEDLNRIYYIRRCWGNNSNQY